MLVALPVIRLLLGGERTIVERNSKHPALGFPLGIGPFGHEETTFAFDIALFHVGCNYLKVDGHPYWRLPLITVEVLIGLDVVLVTVGPMKMHLLTVVGDRVAMVAGIPPFGNEVAVVVIAVKECIEVVVNVGLQGSAAATGASAGLC